MKGQIIGDSVFVVHEKGYLCGVGRSGHGNAVVEERRKKLNSIDIGYYCAAHADSQKYNARKRAEREVIRRKWLPIAEQNRLAMQAARK